jgi:nitrate/TMAO reductase-like tetraheme cytochrome c subunit
VKFWERVRNFFFPAAGSPAWMFIVPYAILAVLVIALIGGGTYTWDYTNSPKFCGTSCHTMPPQNSTYLASPHANVYCTECHLGRGFFGQTVARKSEDVREVVAQAFHLYEFPIRASRTRPALETCEKCHQPEAFASDSLRTITHFASDRDNTASTDYLVMKTGGGAKRQGLGLGIHWHIVNQVEYYATDVLGQNIPYVRVHNDDGTTTEYVDVQSGFDPKSIGQGQLKTMDCVTCHNRVTHNFMDPAQSVDLAMSRGLINPGLPNIHLKAVELLTAQYDTRDDAVKAFGRLEQYYQNSTYKGHEDQVAAAIQTIQGIYDNTVFLDQKVDWTTYPNNVGHINSPGCFRCHDGKHLDSKQQAIRLECNLCHSIPVVAGPDAFVARIEISRGPEPEAHRNPNWISLHSKSIDTSCSACHSMADAGGTSNTSFCSNSACHGNVFTFAGFDAPNMRAILQAQLPAPAPTPTPGPPVENPTYEANIGRLFSSKCGACHNPTTLAGGLDLTTYAGAIKGGKDGAAIVPGDPTNSLLLKIQADQHFANLVRSELDIVTTWIEAGAPEK